MIQENVRRVLPVLLTALFSLTSCKLHEGSLAWNAIHRVTRPLRADPLDYLPHPDLKQWAARPGPRLEVQAGKSIPGSLLIRDDELGAKARKAGRPSSGLSGRAGDLMGFVTTLLAIASGSESKSNLGSIDDTRRQLALNEFPFVMLQGEELLYLGQDQKMWPKLARAGKHSKVTIITKDGTFFGIARRIHFRSGLNEVILEGDPTVQSGEQHIKGSKPDAIMRLDFKNRRVIVNGPFVEKKLFR
jgi:hypothetical protein